MAGLWPRIRLPQRYSPRCPEHREQVFQAPAPPRRATRHTLARSPPHMRHLAPLSRHAPEVGPTPARPCLDTVDPRPLLALDTLDGSCNRRGDGRSFGLATAALPLPKPPDKRAGSFPFSRVLQEKRRGDERIRTAYSCSLRAIDRALQGVSSRTSPCVSFESIVDSAT